MFTILGNELWQYDTDREVLIELEEGQTITEVHFATGKTSAYRVTLEEGQTTVNIPQDVLQSGNPLIIFAWVGTEENGRTLVKETFPVRLRNKPQGYIFTPSVLKKADLFVVTALTTTTTDKTYAETVEALENKKKVILFHNDDVYDCYGWNDVNVFFHCISPSSTLFKQAYLRESGLVLSTYDYALTSDVTSAISSHNSSGSAHSTLFSGKADTVHTHTESDITDLKDYALDSDLESVANRVTTIEGKEDGWDSKSDFDGSYNSLTDVPESFPPSEHNHDDRYSILSHTHTWDNITVGADAIYDALGLSIVDGKLCVTYEE